MDQCVNKLVAAQKLGVYVSVTLMQDSEVAIFKRLSTIGLIDKIDLKKLHVTLMYCKNPGNMHGINLNFNAKAEFASKIIDIEFWEGHDKLGYLVAKLDSKQLHHEFRRLTALGLKHSFDDYSPHVTLLTGDSARAAEKKIRKIKNALVGMSLILTNEKAEPLED